MGLIFDFSWKIPGVLKCIPGVKFPKYTYTLIHFNTVIPPPKFNQIFDTSRRIMYNNNL